MDLERIKQLMSVMGEFKMKKLVLKDVNGEEIELEKESSYAPIEREVSATPAAVPTIKKSEDVPAASLNEEVGYLIPSPMVGTFYSSPSPDEAPFVKVGDTVDEETVVCIVEAMKVMNEVKAGKKGTIAEIYLQSGAPVEYGTKLFRIVE